MTFLRAFSTVSIVTLLSRLLGFVRDLLAAYFFGASLIYDAFLTAFTAPNLLRRLFGEGALNAAVIPTFAQYQSDGEESTKFIASLLGWLLLTVGTIVSVAVIIALILLNLPLSEKWVLTLDMFWRMFPYAILICLVAAYAALLNVKGRFFAPAAAPIILNIFWIATLLFLGFYLKLLDRGLAYTLCSVIVAAGLAQLLLQMVSARRAGIPQTVSLRHHKGVKRVRSLILPMMFGMALYQVNVVADRLIVLGFVEKEGGVTALFYANRLIQFPLALIGISAATALFPAAAKAVKDRATEHLSHLLRRSTSAVILLATPASVGLIFLRREIVSVLFQRGRFSEEAAIRTADVLLFYAVALLFFCLTHIITRLLYAKERVRPVVVVTALCTLLNLILNLVLVFYIAERGVALATAVSSILNFSLLLLIMDETGRRAFLEGFKSLLSASVGSMLMTLSLILIRHASAPSTIRLVLSVSVGFCVYFTSILFLKRERLRDIMGSSGE